MRPCRRKSPRDGKTATVTMKIEYENGKTDEDVMKLKQNDKGRVED